MQILPLVLVSISLFIPSHSSDISDDSDLTCVSLAHSGNYSLNKYLCQQIGINPCNTHPITDNIHNNIYFSLDKNIIQDSPNPELCINKLLSLLATLTCVKSNGIGYIRDNLSFNSITGETTIFISSNICKDIWQGCTSRGMSDYAYLFTDRESLRFCNNLASADSPVKLLQCQADSNGCVDKVLAISTGEIAEVNWLLGGGLDYALIKSKIRDLLILATFIILSIALILLNSGKYRRRIRKKWKDNVIYFDLNLL